MYVGSMVLSVCLLLTGVVFAAEQATTSAPLTEQQKSMSPLAKASEVIGMTVTNTKGEKLGKVDEVLLSPQGCAKYAVLSHGGLLGIGDKLVPLPWSALKPSKDGKTLIVGLDKEILEKAPNFDPKQWPDMSSAEWQKKLQYLEQK
jgi:sporulation protein YlmC with PRC-barrel domain